MATRGYRLFRLVGPPPLIPLFSDHQRATNRESPIIAGPPSRLSPSSPPTSSSTPNTAFSSSMPNAVTSNTFYADFLIDARRCSFQCLLRQFLPRHPTLFFPPSSPPISSSTPDVVICGVFSDDFVINSRRCPFPRLLGWLSRIIDLAIFFTDCHSYGHANSLRWAHWRAPFYGSRLRRCEPNPLPILDYGGVYLNHFPILDHGMVYLTIFRLQITEVWKWLPCFTLELNVWSYIDCIKLCAEGG